MAGRQFSSVPLMMSCELLMRERSASQRGLDALERFAPLCVWHPLAKDHYDIFVDGFYDNVSYYQRNWSSPFPEWSHETAEEFKKMLCFLLVRFLVVNSFFFLFISFIKQKESTGFSPLSNATIFGDVLPNIDCKGSNRGSMSFTREEVRITAPNFPMISSHIPRGVFGK